MNSRRLRSSSRRAGFTLVEVSVVVAFASLLVGYVASIALTTSTVNRDTYIENDLLLLGNKILDEAAESVGGAANFTAVSANAAAPFTPFVRYQHEWDDDADGIAEATDSDGVLTLGARLSPTRYTASWSTQLQWIDEGLDIREAVAQLDLNLDGDTNDVLDCGRLEVQHFNAATGGTLQQSTRQPLSQGRVFVLNQFRSAAETGPRATDGLDNDLDGAVDAADNAASDVYLFSRVGQPGVLPQTLDRAIQLNLNLVHLPTVRAGTRGGGPVAEIKTLRLKRVITLRGGGF